MAVTAKLRELDITLLHNTAHGAAPYVTVKHQLEVIYGECNVKMWSLYEREIERLSPGHLHLKSIAGKGVVGICYYWTLY